MQTNTNATPMTKVACDGAGRAVTIRFKGGVPPACSPTAATMVGTYFFSSAANHSGVYAFYSKLDPDLAWPALTPDRR